MDREKIINVGGELIPVPVDHVIDIGFADILEYEASQDRSRIPKVQISSQRKETYPSDIIDNLKADIHQFARSVKNPNEIFRTLALRYHSNFYAQRSSATIDLADEHTKVLIAMRQDNLIEEIANEPVVEENQVHFQRGPDIGVSLHETIDINELKDFGIPGAMMRELHRIFSQHQSTNPNDVLCYLILGGIGQTPSSIKPIAIRQTNGLVADLAELSSIIVHAKAESLAPLAIYHNHTQNLVRAYQSLGLPGAYALCPTATELLIPIPDHILPANIPHIITTIQNNKVMHGAYRLAKPSSQIPYISDTRCVDPRELYDKGIIELLNLRINPGTNSFPQYNDLALSFIDR